MRRGVKEKGRGGNAGRRIEEGKKMRERRLGKKDGKE